MGKCREKRKRKRQRKKETKKLVKKEWKKEQQKDRQIDQTKKKKEKCNQSVIGYWRQEFPCLKLSEGHYCNSSHGTTMHSKSRAGPIVLCQEKSVETQSSERIFLCPSLPVSLCVAVFPTPPSPSASLGFSQAKKNEKTVVDQTLLMFFQSNSLQRQMFYCCRVIEKETAINY